MTRIIRVDDEVFARINHVRMTLERCTSCRVSMGMAVAFLLNLPSSTPLEPPE